jgi:hypothetical protein
MVALYLANAMICLPKNQRSLAQQHHPLLRLCAPHLPRDHKGEVGTQFWHVEEPEVVARVVLPCRGSQQVQQRHQQGAPYSSHLLPSLQFCYCSGDLVPSQPGLMISIIVL